MKTIYAKEYGIVPGAEQCQIEAVSRMVLQNTYNTRFVFEPGEYHFYRNHALERKFAVSNSEQADCLKIAIFMENMCNIAIDGQGSQFIFHGDMTPIAVSCCQNICISNLSIDFAVPMSAEARILAADRNGVVIHLNSADFPYHIEEETLVFENEFQRETSLFAALEFDARDNRVREGAGDTFPKVKAYEMDKNIVRLEGEFAVVSQAGNYLVLRHGKRIHPGMLVQYSEDIAVENIMMHQTAGLGILFQFNHNISVSGVSFEANRQRGFVILSGHDDGLHFSNNRGTICIQNCSFRGLMDDPVNVHGTAVRVLRKTAPNVLRCAYCHPQSVGFDKWASQGDEIALIRPDNRECYCTATALSYRLITATEFELILTADVSEEMGEGDALENLSNTPSLICRKNYFGSVRARGVLVTTPKPVLIEDNVFESSGSAILMSGDVNEWYESGTCADVTIRGNRFLRCCTSGYQFCEGVIHIEPGVKSGQSKCVHHNIKIEDNLFLLADSALIYADHTKDMTVENNCIFADNEQEKSQVILKECRNICVRNNVSK